MANSSCSTSPSASVESRIGRFTPPHDSIASPVETAPTSTPTTSSTTSASAAPPVPVVPQNTPAAAPSVAADDAADALDMRALAAGLASASPDAQTSSSGGESARSVSSGGKARSARTTYPEHTNWAGMVEDDLANSLRRLQNLAVDEHKADGGKSVERYYSERLARLVREGPVEFDVWCLE